MPKKNKPRTIRDNIVEAANSSMSRNSSVIPAMKMMGVVEPSRKNVMHGKRKRRNRELDIRSGKIDWNSPMLLPNRGTGLDLQTQDKTINTEPVDTYEAGKALSHDGIDDFTTLATEFTSSALTISFWFRITSAASGNKGIFGYGAVTNFIRYAPTLNAIQYRSGSTTRNFTIPSIGVNDWYHVLIWDDGTTNSRLFINGVESSSGALGTVSGITLSQIGTSLNSSSPIDLDDVILKKEAISNPESSAIAIYNSGVRGVNPTSEIEDAEQVYFMNDSYENEGSDGGDLTPNNMDVDPFVEL